MSLFQYLNRFLDRTDPSASLKHLAYAAVVTFGCLWLSWELIARGITANWVAAFLGLLSAVTVGKVVGSGPSPAPTTGAVPDQVSQ
jgi:hypothetical protein